MAVRSIGSACWRFRGGVFELQNKIARNKLAKYCIAAVLMMVEQVSS